MKILKRLNDALPALVVTILLYGLLIESIVVWFVNDKIRFTSGLFIGVACAVGMAIHIAVVIRDAVDTMGQKSKLMSAKSVLRYLVVVLVFFLMMYFDLGNLYAAFVGVLGLKVCAYVQPFIHKRILKDYPQQVEPLVDSEEEVKP